MQSMGEAIKETGLAAMLQRGLQRSRENPTSFQVSGTTTIHRCQKCRDEGGEFVKAPVQQTVKGELVEIIMDHWRVCECIERAKMEKIMRMSHITRAFREMTFDRFDVTGVVPDIAAAHQKALIYANHFKKIKDTPNNGIILMGQSGCGKTHLLAAITNKLLDEDQEVLYVPWVETMEMIKDDMSKEDVNSKRFEKMQKVGVLFIDDLFKPPNVPTPYEIRKVFQIINYRYQEKKPIMISTERTMEYLWGLDEGMGSRIEEMCTEFIAEIHGGRELNKRRRRRT